MNRDTNKKKAEALAEIHAISARYTSEAGLEIYTGISAKCFNTLRSKTPNRWSVEQVKKALADGELIGPPYKEVGGKRIYDLRKVDEWMTLFPERGTLPDMTAELQEEQQA
jgi:hypothetical protein